MRRWTVASQRPIPIGLVGLLLVCAFLSTHAAPSSAPTAAADFAAGPLPESATGPGPTNNSSHGPSTFAFTVSFIAEGLPGGTTWGVILNGTTESGSTDEITFGSVSEGTMTYQILSPGDFAASPSSGYLQVTSPERVAVAFTGGNPPPPAFLVPPLELELLVGIGTAGILAVVGLELVERRRRRKLAHRPTG